MKGIMIKVIVVLFGVSAYFNVSMYFDQQKLNDQVQRLEAQTEQLEELNEQLENYQSEKNACNKLRVISIVVVNENEDLNETVVHCTNEVLLGDAMDELQEEMSIVYDPKYSKDYIYGRMIISFYDIEIEFEEYYAITIDNIYAPAGIDLIEIEDGSEYAFTLTRWSN